MRPEQERALAYLDRKGTSADSAAVYRAVARTFEQLERRLDTIDPGTAGARPTPDQWSLHEIVDHLIESHRPAVGQLRAALSGQDPGEAIPAGILSPDPQARGWAERVTELRTVHRDFLHELARGDDAATPREIPIVMVLKVAADDGKPEVLEWIERLHWRAFAIGVKVHSLEHLAQIDRVEAALVSSS